LPPGSAGHLLGTDDLGRDHLSRLLFAGQVSLSVGFIAAALAIGIGVSLGIITGYYGGIVDDFVNWVIATLNSIPSLFLLLIVAAVLQPSPTTLIVVLGFLGWTTTTRLVRGETLSLREREYIVSARSAGASPLRIMFVHILPNLFSIIVITLAIDIGNLILVEAALSFLGLGIKAPTPSWGNMLTGAQSYFTKGPFLVFAPGLLIFVTVLCLYVIGDGLRDAFDPTAKD
jgi:peptide/nickel transport system permease protein